MDSEYHAFADRVSAILARQAPTFRLEIVGSVARGEAQHPYSDLDLLVVTPEHEGPVMRDDMRELASASGNLLTFFVDPFCYRGTICSIYRGPLKVDWFVAEEVSGRRHPIWSGRHPPPSDPEGHPWDWIWWLWGKVRTGRLDLTAKELSKLWQFLVLQGSDPRGFPPAVPDADQARLERLVLETVQKLPAQSCPVAKEVRTAIENDVRR